VCTCFHYIAIPFSVLSVGLPRGQPDVSTLFTRLWISGSSCMQQRTELQVCHIREHGVARLGDWKNEEDAL